MRYEISRKINLFLAKGLKVPRQRAQAIARGCNIAMAPFALAPRRAMADKIKAAPASSAIRIDPDEPHCITRFEGVAETAGAIARAKEIYDKARKGKGLEKFDGGKSKKDFLVYASQSEQTARHHELMRFAVARPILDAVTRYLGTVPIVNSVNIMISEPNQSAIGSQLYHLDFADDRQIKLFVALEDVTSEHGPFTYVSLAKTRELVAKTGYDRGRLTIEQVEHAIGAENQIPLICKKGEGILIDTSKCMHYGSKGNKYPRLMLQVQYTDYYVPEQPPAKWPVAELTRALNLDEVQVMALGG